MFNYFKQTQTDLTSPFNCDYVFMKHLTNFQICFLCNFIKHLTLFPRNFNISVKYSMYAMFSKQDYGKRASLSTAQFIVFKVPCSSFRV